MRFRFIALFLGVLAALALALPATALEGRAPDFTLRTLDGKIVRMAEMTEARKVVLLSFWATWCGPCQVEMPHLQRLHETYGEKGLVVLSISVDDAKSAAQVKPLIRRSGYAFQVGVDTDGKVVTLYNPSKTVPYTVLVDRSGSIARVHSGYQPGDEKGLEEEVRALLEPPQ